MPRKCSLCHVEDRPELIEEAQCNCKGGDCLGHSADCRKVEHFVKRDIRLHTGPVTQSMQKKGWQERAQGFRGKPAIERLICTACVYRVAESEEIQAFRQKVCDEMNDDKPPTMYQILSV